MSQAVQTAGTPAAFVSLREFWAHFMRSQPSLPPPVAQPVAEFLETFFGRLTRHQFGDVQRLPITAVCTDCRNNTNERRASVCETHVGAIQGTLERITGVPLELRYNPVPHRECTIELEIRRTSNGEPLIPWARRAPYIAIRNSREPAVVEDLRTGREAIVSPETLAILAALDRVLNADELAATVALSTEQTRALLDECYRAGWVECAFAPTSDRPAA